MKLARLAGLLAVSSLALGCFAPGSGAGSAEPASPPKYVVPKESQDALRKGEQQAFAQADAQADERLDADEKKTLKVVLVVLGRESQYPGMPVPEAASSSIRALRSAKMKLRLEPVVDGEGKAVNDDFLQLKDSFTDRVAQLNKKVAEGRASKAEMKELQDGARQASKLNDLRTQVSALSMQMMFTNDNVQSSALSTMFRVSSIVRSRKQMEMELTADDYALIRRGLERQKRAEAIAATMLATMGALQAVINGNGDPKAIDVIGEAALKAFPVKLEVSDDDAKQYVAALGANVQKVKARYEAGLRKVHGDKKYERTYKAGVDAMFAQAENAQNAKTVSQIANETMSRYREDVIKCKRGEEPGPGSMVSSCKAIRRAALTGDTSDLPPGAKKVFDETGGATGAGDAPALRGKAGAALSGAEAAMNGDVDGVLDSAGKLFPGDGTIGASLRGIAALKKGDAKGAISAALTFVPVPGLKDAFGLASKLLFRG